MRDGLRFSVALNEFVVAAVCVTVIACTVGYLYTHMPRPVPAPVQDACASKEPTITIEQTLFIPVPATVVKVIVPQVKPQVVTPETNVQPEQEADPVFEHRTPIITKALQEPMPDRIARN